MSLLKKALILSFILSSALFFSPQIYAIGDSARVESRIDQVYTQFGLTGENVVVAIIDRGIDYRHPDFIDENGNTRIAFIYDMLDNSGANDPDNPYGVGTIFDSTEINNALTSGNVLTTMDWHGHGIATTGIACGNGRGITAQTYQGVAPKAKIIAIKAFTDYFPAFPGNPGQTGFFNPDYLKIALDFVSDKVDAMNLPSVTLMNLGSIGGPTDGTSDICRAMDDFTDIGKLLVCGVGDDGGGDNRASGGINQADTAVIEINKVSAGNLRFDLWYSGDDRFDIIVEKPDGSVFGPFASPATNNNNDDRFLNGINFYHRGSNVEFSNATNDKRELLIDITQGTGIFKIKLIGATIVDGDFSASLNPANYSLQNKFLTYVQNGGSINDYASAFNVITPTDYVAKNDWIDIDGIPRARTGEGNKDELWIGSSEGPTIDGRLGVDVAAPGEVLFTSYSSGTWYSNNRFLMVQGGNEKYGLQNAVSAASPLVTGVLALMLELDANLTPDRAREILRVTARADAFTGSVPNITWGHGKLDALAAVQETANPSSLFPLKNQDNLMITLAPNPFNEAINLRFDEFNLKSYSVSVFNLQGISLINKEFNSQDARLNTNHLPSGIYFVKVEQNGKMKTFKVTKTF